MALVTLEKVTRKSFNSPWWPEVTKNIRVSSFDVILLGRITLVALGDLYCCLKPWKSKNIKSTFIFS